jgi:hypothetical protein
MPLSPDAERLQQHGFARGVRRGVGAVACEPELRLAVPSGGICVAAQQVSQAEVCVPVGAAEADDVDGRDPRGAAPVVDAARRCTRSRDVAEASERAHGRGIRLVLGEAENEVDHGLRRETGDGGTADVLDAEGANADKRLQPRDFRGREFRPFGPVRDDGDGLTTLDNERKIGRERFRREERRAIKRIFARRSGTSPGVL